MDSAGEPRRVARTFSSVGFAGGDVARAFAAPEFLAGLPALLDLIDAFDVKDAGLAFDRSEDAVELPARSRGVYCGVEYGRTDSMRALFAKLSRLIGRRDAPAGPAESDVRPESADKEAEADAVRLEECTAVWKAAPGLLVDVSGAGIAAIVRCRESKHDGLGFRVVIEVEEPLLVPETLKKGDTAELGGTWRAVSFDRESVKVPGSFSIYFGEQGVGRVRQFWNLLPPGKKRRPAPRPFFSMLQQCFHVGRPGGISEQEFQKRLKMFARTSAEPP